VSLHQKVEGLVVLPADHAVLIDQHPVEDRLIHQSPPVGVEVQIRLVAVLGLLGCQVSRQAHLFQGGVGGFQPSLDGQQFVADALLLGLQQVERHRPGVVGVQQLGALVL
jgi:hypothetical protein